MNAQATSLQDFQAELKKLGKDVVREEVPDKERVRRAKQAFMRKLDGRRAVDLDTCLHCGMCAEACPFYEATQNEKYAPVYKYRLLRRFYRREMSPVRWFYKPFTRDISIDDLREWKHYVFDACTGCARCDMICPMGINVSTLIRVVREGLGAAGMMPDELADLRQEQDEKNSVLGVNADRLRELVDQLAGEGVNIPLDKEQSEYMLLTTATEVLLFPDALAANAKILNKSGINWTIFTDAFEAANLGYITGDTPMLKRILKRLVDKARANGIKTVIVPESGHGYHVLRWLGANAIKDDLPFDVLSMPEFITRELGEGKIALKKQANGTSVTYHDPCRLGRKGGVLQEPRDILTEMGFELRETHANGRENYCCGGGCGEFALDGAAKLHQQAFELKKHEFQQAGADKVVTGCASCRYNLQAGAERAGWHTPVTSLVETVAANLAD
jgi:Fe-S oxidoreductase